MKLTENIMLAKKYLGAKVLYQGVLKKNLRPVIFSSSPKHVTVFSQFPENNSYNPWTFKTVDHKFVRQTSDPLTHKVYNSDELDFLTQYENYGEVDLHLLARLAEDHERCTFVIKDKLYLNLMAELPAFSQKFKYKSHVSSTDRSMDCFAQNYLLTVSFYKINSFLVDLYDNSPEGFGVAFEIMSTSRSIQFPFVGKGCYLLLSNQYDGIFYADGNQRLQENIPDFQYYYDDFTHTIQDYCAIDAPLQKEVLYRGWKANYADQAGEVPMPTAIPTLPTVEMKPIKNKVRSKTVRTKVDFSVMKASRAKTVTLTGRMQSKKPNIPYYSHSPESKVRSGHKRSIRDKLGEIDIHKLSGLSEKKIRKYMDSVFNVNSDDIFSDDIPKTVKRQVRKSAHFSSEDPASTNKNVTANTTPDVAHGDYNVVSINQIREIPYVRHCRHVFF